MRTRLVLIIALFVTGTVFADDGFWVDSRASVDSSATVRAGFYSDKNVSRWSKIYNLVRTTAEMRADSENNLPIMWGFLTKKGEHKGKSTLNSLQVTDFQNDVEDQDYIAASRQVASDQKEMKVNRGVAFARLDSSGKVHVTGIIKIYTRKYQSQSLGDIQPEIIDLPEDNAMRLFEEVADLFISGEWKKLTDEIEKENAKQKKKAKEANDAVEELF